MYRVFYVPSDVYFSRRNSTTKVPSGRSYRCEVERHILHRLGNRAVGYGSLRFEEVTAETKKQSKKRRKNGFDDVSDAKSATMTTMTKRKKRKRKRKRKKQKRENQVDEEEALLQRGNSS